jgi:hypothetical protein
MKWQEVEPTLRATYSVLEHSALITGEDVNVAMGRQASDASAGRVFEHLDHAGYINATFGIGVPLPYGIRATEKGLQYCAGWPIPGSSPAFITEFLRAVEERASAPETPTDERGRLRSFAEAASGVGKDLLTDIASKVTEHQTGLKFPSG